MAEVERLKQENKQLKSAYIDLQKSMQLEILKKNQEISVLKRQLKRMIENIRSFTSSMVLEVAETVTEESNWKVNDTNDEIFADVGMKLTDIHQEKESHTENGKNKTLSDSTMVTNANNNVTSSLSNSLKCTESNYVNKDMEQFNFDVSEKTKETDINRNVSVTSDVETMQVEVDNNDCVYPDLESSSELVINSSINSDNVSNKDISMEETKETSSLNYINNSDTTKVVIEQESNASIENSETSVPQIQMSKEGSESNLVENVPSNVANVEKHEDSVTFYDKNITDIDINRKIEDENQCLENEIFATQDKKVERQAKVKSNKHRSDKQNSNSVRDLDKSKDQDVKLKYKSHRHKSTELKESTLNVEKHSKPKEKHEKSKSRHHRRKSELSEESREREKKTLKVDLQEAPVQTLEIKNIEKSYKSNDKNKTIIDKSYKSNDKNTTDTQGALKKNLQEEHNSKKDDKADCKKEMTEMVNEESKNKKNTSGDLDNASSVEICSLNAQKSKKEPRVHSEEVHMKVTEIEGTSTQCKFSTNNRNEVNVPYSKKNTEGKASVIINSNDNPQNENMATELSTLENTHTVCIPTNTKPVESTKYFETSQQSEKSDVQRRSINATIDSDNPENNNPTEGEIKSESIPTKIPPYVNENSLLMGKTDEAFIQQSDSERTLPSGFGKRKRKSVSSESDTDGNEGIVSALKKIRQESENKMSTDKVDENQLTKENVENSTPKPTMSIIDKASRGSTQHYYNILKKKLRRCPAKLPEIRNDEQNLMKNYLSIAKDKVAQSRISLQEYNQRQKNVLKAKEEGTYMNMLEKTMKVSAKLKKATDSKLNFMQNEPEIMDDDKEELPKMDDDKEVPKDTGSDNDHLKAAAKIQETGIEKEDKVSTESCSDEEQEKSSNETKCSSSNVGLSNSKRSFDMSVIESGLSSFINHMTGAKNVPKATKINNTCKESAKENKDTSDKNVSVIAPEISSCNGEKNSVQKKSCTNEKFEKESDDTKKKSCTNEKYEKESDDTKKKSCTNEKFEKESDDTKENVQTKKVIREVPKQEVTMRKQHKKPLGQSKISFSEYKQRKILYEKPASENITPGSKTNEVTVPLLEQKGAQPKDKSTASDVMKLIGISETSKSTEINCCFNKIDLIKKAQDNVGNVLTQLNIPTFAIDKGRDDPLKKAAMLENNVTHLLDSLVNVQNMFLTKSSLKSPIKIPPSFSTRGEGKGKNLMQSFKIPKRPFDEKSNACINSPQDPRIKSHNTPNFVNPNDLPQLQRPGKNINRKESAVPVTSQYDKNVVNLHKQSKLISTERKKRDPRSLARKMEEQAAKNVNTPVSTNLSQNNDKVLSFIQQLIANQKQNSANQPPPPLIQQHHSSNIETMSNDSLMDIQAPCLPDTSVPPPNISPEMPVAVQNIMDNYESFFNGVIPEGSSEDPEEIKKEFYETMEYLNNLKQQRPYDENLKFGMEAMHEMMVVRLAAAMQKKEAVEKLTKEMENVEKENIQSNVNKNDKAEVKNTSKSVPDVEMNSTSKKSKPDKNTHKVVHKSLLGSVQNELSPKGLTIPPPNVCEISDTNDSMLWSVALEDEHISSVQLNNSVEESRDSIYGDIVVPKINVSDSDIVDMSENKVENDADLTVTVGSTENEEVEQSQVVDVSIDASENCAKGDDLQNVESEKLLSKQADENERKLSISDKANFIDNANESCLNSETEQKLKLSSTQKKQKFEKRKFKKRKVLKKKSENKDSVDKSKQLDINKEISVNDKSSAMDGTNKVINEQSLVSSKLDTLEVTTVTKDTKLPKSVHQSPGLLQNEEIHEEVTVNNDTNHALIDVPSYCETKTKDDKCVSSSTVTVETRQEQSYGMSTLEQDLYVSDTSCSVSVSCHRLHLIPKDHSVQTNEEKESEEKAILLTSTPVAKNSSPKQDVVQKSFEGSDEKEESADLSLPEEKDVDGIKCIQTNDAPQSILEPENDEIPSTMFSPLKTFKALLSPSKLQSAMYSPSSKGSTAFECESEEEETDSYSKIKPSAAKVPLNFDLEPTRHEPINETEQLSIDHAHDNKDVTVCNKVEKYDNKSEDGQNFSMEVSEESNHSEDKTDNQSELCANNFHNSNDCMNTIDKEKQTEHIADVGLSHDAISLLPGDECFDDKDKLLENTSQEERNDNSDVKSKVNITEDDDRKIGSDLDYDDNITDSEESEEESDNHNISKDSHYSSELGEEVKDDQEQCPDDHGSKTDNEQCSNDEADSLEDGEITDSDDECENAAVKCDENNTIKQDCSKDKKATNEQQKESFDLRNKLKSSKNKAHKTGRDDRRRLNERRLDKRCERSRSAGRNRERNNRNVEPNSARKRIDERKMRRRSRSKSRPRDHDKGSSRDHRSTPQSRNRERKRSPNRDIRGRDSRDRRNSREKNIYSTPKGRSRSRERGGNARTRERSRSVSLDRNRRSNQLERSRSKDRQCHSNKSTDHAIDDQSSSGRSRKRLTDKEVSSTPNRNARLREERPRRTVNEECNSSRRTKRKRSTSLDNKRKR